MLRCTGRVTRVQHTSGSRERDGVKTTWHRHTISVLVADVAVVQFSCFADSEQAKYAPGQLVDVAVIAKVNRYGDGIELRLEGDWAEFETTETAAAAAPATVLPQVTTIPVSNGSKVLATAGSSNGSHAKP